MNLGRFETGLNVKDIGRSLAFYRALGFRYIDGGVDIGTVALRKGDCRLTLYQGHLHPPRTQLIFWQGDVAAIARDLTGKGLRFEDGNPRKDDRGNASALMMDPDGHPLFFINMPIDYVDHAAHVRPSPPYRPRLRLKPDKTFGRFELGLNVSNVQGSCDFYGKLGFQVTERDDDRPSVTLENNDCRIALCEMALPEDVRRQPAGPGVQLIFRQSAMETLVQHLTRKRVLFETWQAKGENGGTVAHVRDPDKHAIFFLACS
jgi:catechol 2,3-dioxygenase-like lactoylglutathione lyase family enzyme